MMMRVRERTDVEDVLQALLRLRLLHAQLRQLEVDVRERVALLRVVPTGTRHLHQAVAEQQDEQEEAPRVGGGDRQHLELRAAGGGVRDGVGAAGGGGQGGSKREGGRGGAEGVSETLHFCDILA